MAANELSKELQQLSKCGWTVQFREDRSPGSASEVPTLWSDGNGLAVAEVGFDHFILSFADLAKFNVNFAQTFVQITPVSDRVSHAMMRHLLLDQIFPRILAHGGRLVIHASGVSTSHGAIILAGSSGFGKSTLAASLHAAGHELLGDDAIIIHLENLQVLCQATYRSLRLFPDSIASIPEISCRSSPIDSNSSKLNVLSVDTDSCDAQPMPIIGVFLLGEPLEEAIQVTRLSASDACMAIVEHSFWLDPTDIRCTERRLRDASAVASDIPVFRINYPRNYSDLKRVHEAIFDALKTN